MEPHALINKKRNLYIGDSTTKIAQQNNSYFNPLLEVRILWAFCEINYPNA
jgi:hypothetical protein